MRVDLDTGEQFDPELGFYYLRARYNNPQTGRFWTMDSFEGQRDDPSSLYKYMYCHDNAVNKHDPNGYAAYFVERRFEDELKASGWSSGYGHGYFLFTDPSDNGLNDPFQTPLIMRSTFSWHPHRWEMNTEGVQVPGRVWERHPFDINPGAKHSAIKITTDPSQQAALLNYIQSWIHTAPVGYELGKPKIDTSDTTNTIGTDEHVNAPPKGIYYSLYEQNCVWWVMIMLKQSNINVPLDVYDQIASFNHGEGSASLIYRGQRSAQDVRTLGGIPYGRFKMPITLDIGLFSF